MVCVALNDALLDGLLTVFHTERSNNPTMMINRQSTLQLLSAYDKECLEVGGSVCMCVGACVRAGLRVCR